MKVFISYREEDAAGHAGRLYESLSHRLPEGDIFFYRERPKLGHDFRSRLEKEVSTSGVVLAVIGPDWVTTETAGKRRLSDPEDVVRMELTWALKRRRRIIPVLVRGASMPSPRELPGELRSLPDLEALSLPDDYWPIGVQRLAEAIEAAAVVHDGGKARSGPDAFSILMKENQKVRAKSPSKKK